MVEEANFTDGHKAVFNPETFMHSVHIIGAGGMGSRIAEGLVRMGVKLIHLYDDDEVELKNVANQLFVPTDVGQKKVTALRRHLLKINPDAQIIDHPKRIDYRCSEYFSDVVFLCIDTMEDREVIMRSCLENQPRIVCVIETRMDAGAGISHCFDPRLSRHCDCWWEQFFTDEQADDMAGCGGSFSIMSAIFGTSCIALKQFEGFARTDTAIHLYNRVYQDFEKPRIKRLIWPTNPDYD